MAYKTRQRKVYSIPEDAEEFDGESIPFRLPVHSLVDNLGEYANIPDFQRDKHVWPERYKYEFIKTLCLRGYVPAILVCKRLDGGDGEWIIDGQQRVDTLTQFVLAMKADLAGKDIPKDEDGYYFYFRLSKRHRENLLSYKLRFEELQNPSKALLSRTFLSLQNQVSATTAEKMWAASSSLNDVIKLVYTFSPYFQDFYVGRAKKGKDRRKQSYQMASYPVMIELAAPFAELSGTHLQAALDGRRDDLVYPGLEDTVVKNLDYVQKLFDGVKCAAMTEAIIMYQCVWLLKHIGVDLDETPRGALTSWYAKVQELNKDSRDSGFMNMFAMFTKRKQQMKYWRPWLEEIVYGNLVAGSDSDRVRANMQRFTGWLRNDGICPGCNNPHVQIRDIDKHLFREADRHNGRVTCVSIPVMSFPQRLLVTEA